MAIQIDRVELADIANPKALAAAVFKLSGLADFPGERIEEIAIGCGITEIQTLKTQGFEGALITDDAKADGIILVSAKNNPARRRFTIAHEVGHFLNPWHKPSAGGFQCVTRDMLCSGNSGGRLGMEAQANEFAAELLMPAPLFNAAFRRAGGDPTTQVLKKVSAEASVSVLAAGRRLVDLRQDCALVLSRNNSIEQIYRGADFPYISAAAGRPVPNGCITRLFGHTEGSHSEIEETDPATWTTSTTKRGLQFLEQVLIQAGGFRLTLLVVDESDCDEEEDEWVRERSESRPRFSR